jgi:RecG-like helicase
MKMIYRLVMVSAMALLFASCAQTEARTPVKAAPAGTRYDAVGKVSLHQGQPCAPQVVFNLTAQFQRPVALAAHFHESKLLTEAARHGRRVHVSGAWRHGRSPGCAYVEVTQVMQP